MAQRCSRCCLHQSMKVVNLIVNLCGIGMIIYSLWLQKMWDNGVAQLFPISALPKPWFIYTCFGVGIAVCLSTLVGCMVANCVSKSTLCIYIISLCLLLFLQVGVTLAIFFEIDWGSVVPNRFIYTCFGVGIAVCLSTLVGYMVANCVSKSTLCIYIICLCLLLFLQVGVTLAIFFMIDWGSQIAKYIDEHHRKFNIFVSFHIKICRMIVVMAVVAQINVVVLAVILWAIRTEPRRDSHLLIRPNFTQSFLVLPNPPLPDCLIECCRKCEELNPHESFMSYVKGVFRMRLQRITTSSL